MAQNTFEDKVDNRYRQLFLSTELGPVVLGDMLDRAMFGMDPGDNEEFKAFQHHCKWILSKCGIGGRLRGEKIVKALASVGLKEEKSERE